MTRQFDIILHIGTEKTGTTTLQHELLFNQQRLEESGVFYLTTPERVEARGIAAAAVGDAQPDDFLKQAGIDTCEQRQRFREATITEVHDVLDGLPSHVQTLLISSEHFHSRLRQLDQVEWVRRLFAERARRFTVVCYLRSQADLVESYYSTMLKNGEGRPLGEIADKTCEVSNHYYNYHTLLALWASVFGKDAMVPRLFNPERFEKGDVVADFLRVVGIAVTLKKPGVEGKRYNESLTPLGQGLLRAINLHRQQAEDDPDVLAQCGTFAAAVIAQFPGKGERLSKEALVRIEEEFKTVNAQVRRQWFSEEARLFPPRKRDKPNRVKLHLPVSSEQIDTISQVVELLSGSDGGPVTVLNSCADILRDLAVYYEQKNKDLAWSLMRLARRIRPQGPVIKRKFDEYERIRRHPIRRIRRWISR
ncbi:hypothetical protein [Halomonas halocynthiae]|uniref:hypothetical protein n=1 Tax=Halomonas halocynthiae TaxID=176290 RepID=UPI00040B35AB|nr:hypothetical protein [Halomonas halocynthiae]